MADLGGKLGGKSAGSEEGGGYRAGREKGEERVTVRGNLLSSRERNACVSEVIPSRLKGDAVFKEVEFQGDSIVEKKGAWFILPSRKGGFFMPWGQEKAVLRKGGEKLRKRGLNCSPRNDVSSQNAPIRQVEGERKVPEKGEGSESFPYGPIPVEEDLRHSALEERWGGRGKNKTLSPEEKEGRPVKGP